MARPPYVVNPQLTQMRRQMTKLQKEATVQRRALGDKLYRKSPVRKEIDALNKRIQNASNRGRRAFPKGAKALMLPKGKKGGYTPAGRMAGGLKGGKTATLRSPRAAKKVGIAFQGKGRVGFRGSK